VAQSVPLAIAHECNDKIAVATIDPTKREAESWVEPMTRQILSRSILSKCTLMRVPVKPRKPRLEYGDHGTILGAALTLKEGQEVTISCVSRYGNPPALIKW